MFDFRESKIINLDECTKLSKDSNAWSFIEPVTNIQYVLKFYEETHSDTILYLISEFRKIVALSAEPEIASVFGLVTVVSESNRYIGYLVEYIEGQTLRQTLLGGSFSYENYFTIMSQLSSGLEKCHYYRVHHNDLNLDNILIDAFGNIKLIDFFYDVVESAPNDDIKYFKKINHTVFKNVNDLDQAQSRFIYEAIEEITTLQHLPNHLKAIDEISFELSLIESKAMQMLANLCAESENIKMTEILVETDFVPTKLHSKINDDEKLIVELQKEKQRMNYLDTVEERICINLKSYWYSVFRQLDVTGFASFNTSVAGEKSLVGPYRFKLEITIHPKLVKINRYNKRFKLLPEPVKKPLLEYLFIDDYFTTEYPYYK